MKFQPRTVLLGLLLAANIKAAAQTVYVTDELQVGLHAEKTLNSPIVSVVPVGTPLELVKREEQLSFVREPGGVGGWIDNSYLSENTVANEELLAARTRIATLEQALDNIDVNETSSSSSTILEEQLQQMRARLEQEQQKAASLQKTVAEMEEQLAAGNPESLYEKIQQLSSENNRLQGQLATVLETPLADPIQLEPSSEMQDDSITGQLMVKLLIAVIIGIALGVYIMDLVNRRRHGGFRV